LICLEKSGFWRSVSVLASYSSMFRCDGINPQLSCPLQRASSNPLGQLASAMRATEYWIAGSSRAMTSGEAAAGLEIAGVPMIVKGIDLERQTMQYRFGPRDCGYHRT